MPIHYCGLWEMLVIQLIGVMVNNGYFEEQTLHRIKIHTLLLHLM